MDVTDAPTTWNATDVQTTGEHVEVTARCGCGAKYARAWVTTGEGTQAARTAITKGLTGIGHADCLPTQPEPDCLAPERTAHTPTCARVN